MTKEEELAAEIEKRSDKFTQASDTIWGYAETRFEETKSSALLQKLLQEEGFSIQSDLADMKTAFIASYGSGKPVLAFLGEFDALYGLSQQANTIERKPLVEGGKGHGCGHHALGMGSLAAAVALKTYLQRHHLAGTVRYYGCPGEESGSGKTYLARDGYFQGVDAAFSWHPGNINTVWTYNCLACVCAYFKFTGQGAHAAAAPYLGRSALDAVELMDVGANYLREHVIPEARIHYAITDAGGKSPNVVPPHAAVLYQVRAPHIRQAREIYDRIVKIAKGAALMTETQLEIVFDRASSELLPNQTLQRVLQSAFEQLGPVPIEDADRAFAREIRSTLTEQQKQSDRDNLVNLFGEQGRPLQKKLEGKEILDFVYPYMPTNVAQPISTDVGDASYSMPTAQIMTACFAQGTPAHSWQLVAQGKAPLCHKAFLHAGKVLASAACEVLERPELLQKAKQEFSERLSEEPYTCPIPPEVKPSPVR